MKKSEMVNDKLSLKDWLGEVVDVSDPLEEGRVRVKVFGKFDKLEDDQIPWASPSGFMHSAGSASGSGTFSLPKIGSIVNVQFENDNLYAPVYTYIQHLSDELKEEISGSDYESAQSLLYDTDIEGGLRIFWTRKRGLVIKFADTMLRMAQNKTITITNKATDKYKNDGNVIEIDPKGNLLIDMDKDLKMNIAGNAKIDVGGKADIKVGGKTSLDSDGKIDIKSGGKIDINANGGSMTIDGTTKILLGDRSKEPVILGDVMKKLYDKHTHIGNMGIPTDGPLISMKPALSKNVTVKE